MDTREAFVAAIAAGSPDDDTARLAFSDWLEENGESERAIFIRRHVELDSVPATRPGHERLKADVLARLKDIGPQWFADVSAAFGQPVPTFPRPPGTVQKFLARFRAKPPMWDDPADLHPRWLGDNLVLQFDTNGDTPDASRPLQNGTVRKGLLTDLTYTLPTDNEPNPLSRVFAVEPVTGLSVTFPHDLRSADGFFGPHLRRVRHLEPRLGLLEDANAVLKRIVSADDLSGVRSFKLHGGVQLSVNLDSIISRVEAEPLAVVAESALMRQLTKLELTIDADGLLLLNLHLPAGVPLTSFKVFPIDLLSDPDPGFGVELTRLPVREQLTELDLSYCSLPPEDVEAMAAGPAWPRLETLNLWANRIGPDGLSALGRAANTFPQLRNLDVGDGELDDSAVADFARGPLARQLTRLALRDEGISGRTAVMLAQKLARGPLRELVLLERSIPAGDRRQIAAALPGRVVFRD